MSSAMEGQLGGAAATPPGGAHEQMSLAYFAHPPRGGGGHAAWGRSQALIRSKPLLMRVLSRIQSLVRCRICHLPQVDLGAELTQGNQGPFGALMPWVWR